MHLVQGEHYPVTGLYLVQELDSSDSLSPNVGFDPIYRENRAGLGEIL